MMEFLQNYGLWVFLGILLSLMVWRNVRGHGAGCCGGVHQHGDEAIKKDDQRGHQDSGCH